MRVFFANLFGWNLFKCHMYSILTFNVRLGSSTGSVFFSAYISGIWTAGLHWFGITLNCFTHRIIKSWLNIPQEVCDFWTYFFWNSSVAFNFLGNGGGSPRHSWFALLIFFFCQKIVELPCFHFVRRFHSFFSLHSFAKKCPTPPHKMTRISLNVPSVSPLMIHHNLGVQSLLPRLRC